MLVITINTMAKKIFVSPYNGDWRVKDVDNQKASGIFDTKAEAVERAIEIARNKEAELFVQNMDGKIGWKNSYGNDPRDIKG